MVQNELSGTFFCEFSRGTVLDNELFCKQMFANL